MRVWYKGCAPAFQAGVCWFESSRPLHFRSLMYFTVYKTTNLINGKIYVGVHRTEDLDDGYLGSGKYLNNAIEKYGKENFSKDIIAICDTEEEMYALEESLVCQAFLTFFSTYNIVEGGHGGATTGILGGLKCRENKLGFCGPITDRMRKARSKTILKFNRTAFLGKKHSEFTLNKMSLSHKGKYLGSLNSQYGTFWITNGIENKKSKGEIPQGWYKGRKRH